METFIVAGETVQAEQLKNRLHTVISNITHHKVIEINYLELWLLLNLFPRTIRQSGENIYHCITEEMQKIEIPPEKIKGWIRLLRTGSLRGNSTFFSVVKGHLFDMNRYIGSLQGYQEDIRFHIEKKQTDTASKGDDLMQDLSLDMQENHMSTEVATVVDTSSESSHSKKIKISYLEYTVYLRGESRFWEHYFEDTHEKIYYDEEINQYYLSLTSLCYYILQSVHTEDFTNTILVDKAESKKNLQLLLKILSQIDERIKLQKYKDQVFHNKVAGKRYLMTFLAISLEDQFRVEYHKSIIIGKMLQKYHPKTVSKFYRLQELYTQVANTKISSDFVQKDKKS
jgi:hypothetical protein